MSTRLPERTDKLWICVACGDVVPADSKAPIGYGTIGVVDHPGPGAHSEEAQFICHASCISDLRDTLRLGPTNSWRSAAPNTLVCLPDPAPQAPQSGH